VHIQSVWYCNPLMRVRTNDNITHIEGYAFPRFDWFIDSFITAQFLIQYIWCGSFIGTPSYTTHWVLTPLGCSTSLICNSWWIMDIQGHSSSPLIDVPSWLMFIRWSIGTNLRPPVKEVQRFRAPSRRICVEISTRLNYGCWRSAVAVLRAE